MAKLNKLSLLATTSVLALTTAVYMPGVTYAEPVPPAESTACVESVEGSIITLTGTCSYDLGDKQENTITLADAAEINITFSDASNLAEGGITVPAGASLTVSGEATNPINITSAGTLVVDGANLGANATLATTGNTTVSGDSVVPTLVANDGTTTIESGTFAKVTNKDNDHVRASGGKYIKSNDMPKGTVNALRASTDTMSVYEDDTYYYIENTLTADAITFADIEATEDVSVDLTADDIKATATGSATGFTYSAPSNSGIAIDNGAGTLIASKPGTYTITATSTFDNTVKKDATITVASTLTSVSLAKNGSSVLSGGAVVGDTVKNNDKLELYTSGSADTSDKVVLNYSWLAADANVVVTAAEDVEAPADSLVTVAQDTESKTISITADKAGTTSVTVTAVPDENTETPSVVQTITFEVEIADKIATGDVAGKTISAKKGDVFNYADLAAITEQGATKTLNDLTFTPAANEAVTLDAEKKQLTVNQGEVINLTVTATDKSGTSVDVTTTIVSVGMFDVDSGGTFTFDENGISNETLTLFEQSTTGTPVSITDVYPDGTPTDYEYTYGFAEVAPVYAEDGTTIESFAPVTENGLLTIVVDEDVASKASVTASAYSDTNETYLATSVNGMTKYVKVEIEAQVNSISILDGETEVAKATPSAKEQVVSEALTLKRDESHTFTIAHDTANVVIEHVYATSSNGNVSVFQSDDNTSFTVTGIKTSESNPVKVTVIPEDGNEYTFTLSVNVTSEIAIPTPEKTVTEGVYTIKSFVNQATAVDVTNASVDNGANIQLYEVNGTIAQKFIFRHNGEGFYTIENMKSGKFLTASANNNVTQEAATGDDTQLWQVVELSDGNYSFISKTSGLFLDVSGAGSANGTNIGVYVKNFTAAQRFHIDKVATLATEQSPVSGTFTVSASLGKTMNLDVLGNSTKDGANVQIYKENGTTAQQFTFTQRDNGFYTISTGTGESEKVLDVEGAGLTAGTNVHQWTNNGTIAQQWLLVDNDDSTVSIISRCNGLYLDVSNAGTTDGTNVQIWEGNGTAAQKFALTSVPVSNQLKQ